MSGDELSVPRSHGDGVCTGEALGTLGVDVVLEDGIRIFNPENVHIGDRVYLGHDAYINGYFSGQVEVGEGSWIGQRCYLHGAGGIRIGKGVGIGPEVKMLTSTHEVDEDLSSHIINSPLVFASIEIGDGADIGVGAVILPGVRIGRGSQVGAGSVVTGEIPDNEVWAGVPARRLRSRGDEGSRYRVHPSAIVEEGANIGPDAGIWHHCHIRSGCHIGAGSSLGKNVYVDPGVTIGERCKIQNNVSVYHGVTLGNDVFVGPSAVFTNDLYARAAHWNDERLTHTRVEDGASIGANATIVCGISVGRYATVGAGAVVTHDIPSHHLVYGTPARVHGLVCECGMKLLGSETLQAGEYGCECGMRYHLSDGGSVKKLSS